MVQLGRTVASLESTPREVSWRAVRSLRAAPVGLAGAPGRRDTFAMALEQAEQLFDAAAATGPAARPLPLFYALSQAGRALSAAHVGGDLWMARGHGIRQSGHGDATGTVADFLIEPAGGASSSYALTAAALGSSGLAGPTRLGDLWPLLPGTHQFPLPGSGPARAMEVHVELYAPVVGAVSANLVGVPVGPGALVEQGLAPGEQDWSGQRREVAAALAQYPSLARYQFATIDGQPIGLSSLGEAGASVRVSWPVEPGTTATSVQERVSVAHGGYTLAYPCLDASGMALHPLMAWWAVLFGLSILARYEPSRWGRAIDVNASQEAVAIEHLLDSALDCLPELIYRSLRAGHVGDEGEASSREA